MNKKKIFYQLVLLFLTTSLAKGNYFVTFYYAKGNGFAAQLVKE